MPGRSGLEFQRDLAAAGATLPIVFITGHGDIPMTVQAMKAGAVDFLTKPFRDQTLLDAVSAGIERDRAQRADAATTQRQAERYATLTMRERQIFREVARGRLNKQIAGRLHLSEITVKTHRGKLMRKMRADSLASLVRMAEALGIREIASRYSGRG